VSYREQMDVQQRWPRPREHDQELTHVDFLRLEERGAHGVRSGRTNADLSDSFDR